MINGLASPRRSVLASGVVLAGLCPSVFADLPQVPGFEVSEYATMPGTGDAIDKLTIDPKTGAIYIGRNEATAAIYRVPPGGGEGSTYGTPIPDPDAVLFDTDGAVSGVPGAVIVGGIIVNDITAQLWAVLPDEQVVSVCGPTGDFLNPTSMTTDASGTMLFADFNTASVLAGGPCPTALFQSPTTLVSIALDDADDIYTLATDGVVRVHSREGDLIDASFASGLGNDSPLRFGPGGAAWGTALYVIDRVGSGELRRYAADGSFEVIGTGFVNGRDMQFGPDGAMYVSMYQERRIVRIAPASCPTDVNGDGFVNVEDLVAVILAWGTADPAADTNDDCTVDVQDLVAVILDWGPCE